MNVYQHIRSINNTPAVTIAGICPGCNREGNLSPIGQDMTFHSSGGVVAVGSRICPNPKCATHVFVIYGMVSGAGQSTTLICTYPAGRIDFDTDGVPDKVKKAFDEALTCAANECYIGAGMLIRKTLEAVCEDRAAAGGNLKDRIADLKTKVTLPLALFEAMDHLRLLGNDAAHIEAKDYDTIGKPEVTAGVELTKEIIKATYQHKGLLAKLIALKK